MEMLAHGRSRLVVGLGCNEVENSFPLGHLLPGVKRGRSVVANVERALVLGVNFGRS